MANFDQLKQSVAAVIKTNGAEEITGAIMQDVLLTIINSIAGGYMFGGVAQHSGNVGNPDYNVFYLAGSGSYTGYGGAITIENGCYGVFRYNGTWHQEVVDIGVRLSGSIAPGETRGVTGDTINTALQTLFENVTSILDSLEFVYNTPSAQQATKAMLDVIVTPTGGSAHTLTTLTLVSATVAAAGLMSAEDKQKLDRMLTDFRSLSFSDTTAAADEAVKIVQTLSATLGENPEAITTITFLAATASKAGLMSAADKAMLDCLVAMIGYYECPTAAGTAAKTVSASGYALTNGGCIRIKMNNANTASNVTLNINSTGAKALYYDGAQASDTNTWEAGEVLEVYYDGTQYQCASGGGGRADRVKYDNTESGIEAENVQEAIDQFAYILGNCYHESQGQQEVDVHIQQSDLENGTSAWASNSSRIRTKKNSLISTEGYASLKITIPYSAVSSDNKIDRCTYVFYDKNKTYLTSLDTGWSYFNGDTVEFNFDLTSDTYRDVAYVGIYFGCASGSISPSSINTSGIVFAFIKAEQSITKAVDETMLVPIVDKITEYNYILSNCYKEGDGTPTAVAIQQSDLVNENFSFSTNTQRVILQQSALIDVTGKSHLHVEIPYSAVSADSNIDRCSIQFFNSSKSRIAAADNGWLNFNGNTVIIDVNLDEALYANVKYISPYFGSNNANISAALVNAAAISVTLYDISKAVDEEMLKGDTTLGWASQLTTNGYLGERVSMSLPYALNLNTYTHENIGTLSGASGSRQGGAVYGNYLFQFHVNMQNVVVFNLSTKQNVQTISLTAISNFHAGSGGFSDKFYDVTDPFPLLYIAGMEQKKINVYRITGTAGSFAISLIQTITLNTPYYLPNIAIDAINDRIVVFAYTQNSWSDATNNKSVVFYCDIPDYTTAEVTISDFSPVSKFPFIYAEQGAFAQYNMLYLSYGNTDTNAGIIVFNYMNGQVKNVIGVKAIGNLEPEALCAYEDKMIMTDQNGNIYQLSF